MKKLSLIILIFLPIMTFAKNDSLVNRVFGINFSTAYLNSEGDENLFAIPNITYTYSKHSISLGPTFTLIDKSPLFYVVAGAQTKPVKSFKLNGISGSYQFSLSDPDKILKFYLQYDLIYYQFSVSPPNSSMYEEKNLVQFLKIGFRTNITKSLYLNPSVGAGFNFSTWEIGQRGFQGASPSWLLKLGLGYVFKKY